jgi:glycerophosphoryl diester phosphodiesterase
MKSVQVIAHRGSSARHPENSWAAFEAAVKERADAIECDVQSTRDRTLIVRHDLAVGHQRVVDMTLAEIDARAPGTVVKATSPGVRTSFMMGSVVAAEQLVGLAAALRVDGVHLCWETRAARPHQLLDRATIGRLRRAGLAITLWHEEREDELHAMVALEPDAICTNTPAVLRRIVESSRH